MLSMCVYEKECASVYDMQEFADESCTISVNIVSKMCHAVQYIVRGKNVARIYKASIFLFQVLGHPSSSLCL